MGERTDTPAIDKKAALLADISKLATELPDRVKWWKSNDWESVFKPLGDKTDEYVDLLIDEFNPEEKVGTNGLTKASLTIETIKGRREKLLLSSSTTGPIVGICQQILAFGAAGLALCVGFSEKLHSFTALQQHFIVLGGIFYFELVILSLFVIIWYLLQTHFRYPFLYFTKIGNSWQYFYYSAVSRDISRQPIQFAGERAKAGSKYAMDFTDFSRLCLTETPKSKLRAELQQYYLLIAYQGYVQQFALRLSNLFSYGFVGAALSTGILAVVGSFK